MRETNICRISVHADERTGKLIVFSVVDNLWKGTASSRARNIDVMFGDRKGRESLSSFSPSRWVPCPDHVTEHRGRRPPCRLPRRGRGRRWRSGRLRQRRGDRLRRAGEGPTSAARFTASGTRAPPSCCAANARGSGRCAPWWWTRQRRHRPCRLRRTPPRCRAWARWCHQGQGGPGSAVCSTGVIGVPLPMPEDHSGIVARAHGLAQDGDAFVLGSNPDDQRVEKRARLQVKLPSGTVMLTGQAKGAGMYRRASPRCSCSSRPTPSSRRDLRPAAGRVREALVRARLGRRPSCPPTTP